MFLEHHGILGQKWGIRRFQNADGSLTDAGRQRYYTADNEWVKKNATRIESKAFSKSKSEMKKVTKELDKKYAVKAKYERQGRRYMNDYNANLAQVMSTKVEKIKAPSGRAVRFVAKNGKYGVYIALVDD